MVTLQQIIQDSGVGETQFWHLVKRVNSKKGYRKCLRSENGKERTIYDPGPTLRVVQETILRQLEDVPISDHSHSCKGRSAITHASPHIGKDVVVSIDVKRCFPTIRHTQVLGVFTSIGFSNNEARVLTTLTTADAHLAQGFLTSPRLQNLVFREIDHRVGMLAVKTGATYTRYVDDLVLSGNRETIRLVGPVKSILRSYGFEVNKEKLINKGVRFKHQSQNVCGVIVNERLTPSQQHMKKCLSAVDQLRHAKVSGGDILKLKSIVAGRIGFIKCLSRPCANKMSKRRHMALNPAHRGKRHHGATSE